MAKYKAIIEYCGTKYYGMQKQAGLPTVQGEIEAALGRFYQQDTPIEYAGRTDVGVHGLGQVITFSSDKTERRPFNIIQGVNLQLLDKEIVVLDVSEVQEDFNCRFHAISRSYLYKIVLRPIPLILDKDRYLWVRHALDIDAMNDAAQVLIGRHDFSAFRSTDCQAASPIKTLEDIKFHVIENEMEDKKLIVEFKARSFLHNMVRNIMGSLIAIGKGKYDGQWLKEVLELKDKQKIAVIAPAHGLYLWKIEYER